MSGSLWSMADESSETPKPRRRYDSPLRRQKAAETRDRILTAGSELIHGYPIWNWSALTVRAVAKRAALERAHGLPVLRQ